MCGRDTLREGNPTICMANGAKGGVISRYFHYKSRVVRLRSRKQKADELCAVNADRVPLLTFHRPRPRSLEAKGVISEEILGFRDWLKNLIHHIFKMSDFLAMMKTPL